MEVYRIIDLPNYQAFSMQHSLKSPAISLGFMYSLIILKLCSHLQCVRKSPHVFWSAERVNTHVIRARFLCEFSSETMVGAVQVSFPIHT